jgi:MoaA/NifB/PqqE/SkfB family radical SAM enzyme
MNTIDISTVTLADFLNSSVDSNSIPLVGSFNITYRCNQRCIHCGIVNNADRREMDFLQICRIMDELREVGCLWLIITGGEPLLRRDFLDIYIYAKKKGFLITLFTNATLITSEIIDCFKVVSPNSVAVSLHAINEDIYGNITGVRSNFKKCLEGIDLLLKAGIHIKIKSNIMQLNKEEIPKIKAYAKELGTKAICNTMIRSKLDGSMESLKARISDEDLIKYELSDERRVIQLKHRYKLLKKPSNQNSFDFYRCVAGPNVFEINPYGELDVHRSYPCLPESQNFSLTEYTFKQAWQNLLEIRSRMPLLGCECRECNLFLLCDICNRGGVERDDYPCQVALKRKEAIEKLFNNA